MPLLKMIPMGKIAEAESLELAESETARLIDVCHSSGLTYWDILNIFLRAVLDLHLKASIEYRTKGGQ